MDVKEYLQNPCGTLSVPYWKAKTLAIPDSMRIIHCSNWNGQYGNFQRFFRIKHDLNDLPPIDYDYDTLSIDYQATQLCEMINESYNHENIVVSEQDILQWKQHKTFREELCVYINVDNGKMAASGIAEFDEVCRRVSLNGFRCFQSTEAEALGKRLWMYYSIDSKASERVL